ncbi:putative adenine-specific DNA methylase N-4/N-6 [Proteus phage vB_PmiS_PM-CJR]|nr:putative adenine-specific DNA methylase N-4/N-6 [Proteus phage vB_PmiS_PM-CJR]
MSVINMECKLGMQLMIADNSIDAIVTDPPYGLSKQPKMEEVLKHWLAGDDYNATGSGFMGKTWDSFVPGPSIWKEAYRCLKPGAWAVVFAGSRTQDLMVLSLRLAGFEIMDTGMWLYGSGFPKSLDISKAIDKSLGAEREVVGKHLAPGMAKQNVLQGAQNRNKYEFNKYSTKPATNQAKQWEGWGTALKPAYEPFILARKPLDGTYANNVLKYGVGGLNIDCCRVGKAADDRHEYGVNGDEQSHTGDENTSCYGKYERVEYIPHEQGRFPANVIHDGLEEPWAKYFYCAKASKKDRDEGLENLSLTSAGEMTDRNEGSDGLNSPRAGAGRTTGARNIHPTVKPTELMRYLCRLVTPPKGLILDPFSGSGSTGKASLLEGFNFIGFEMDSKYCEIANARIKHAHNSRIQS